MNPTTSPIDPPGAWRAVWIAALCLAFAAYVVALARVRRRTFPIRAVVITAIAFQLAPLAGPLLFSDDAFAYWDYGRLAAIHHVNPYRQEPDHVLKPTDLGYGEGLGTDIYGPLFTAGSELHARAVGTSVKAAEVVYRAAAAAGVVALLLILARWAPRPARAVAFVGWNPLLALHFAGGGHNDIWMLLPLVGGLLLARSGRPWLGGVGWAASAFIKASGLALLPLEVVAAFRANRDRTKALALAFAVSVAALALVATALYGTAWPSFLHRASSQLSQTSSISLVYRLTQHGVSRQLAKAILGLLFVIGYVALLVDAWRRRRPRLALAATLLIFTPAWLVPWYGTWPVVLSAIEDDMPGEIGAVAATAYLLTDAIPRL